MLGKLGAGDGGALLVQLDRVDMAQWGDGADQGVSEQLQLDRQNVEQSTHVNEPLPVPDSQTILPGANDSSKTMRAMSDM